MNEKVTILNYWCVNDVTIKKRVLIIADRELYDRKREIETELSGVCAATTLYVPKADKCDYFVGFAKLFQKQDGFHYDAVYFRPELNFEKTDDYVNTLKSLMNVHPNSVWILGKYGNEYADSAVEKAGMELGLDICDTEQLKDFMIDLESSGKYVLPKDEEAIGWMKHELRVTDRKLPKLLMIGDSIVWGAHEYFGDTLDKYFDVTTFVSSMGVNGTRLTETLIELAKMSGVKYDAVFFNNGLHNHGQTVEEYTQNYKQTVDELTGYFSDAVWVLGLSTKVSDNSVSGEEHETPITRQERLDNEKQNALVIEYNKSVKAIAKEKNIPVFDAYSLLEDKDEWKADCYHYNSEGKEFFARALYQKILEVCGIKQEEL